MVCIDLIFISACLDLHETDNSDRSYCDDCTVLDRNNNDRIRRYVSNQERCICKFDKFKRLLCAFNFSGGSRIFLGTGGGRQLPKWECQPIFVPKNCLKIKTLDLKRGAYPWRPLDPPMNLVIVGCELRKFCISFNKKDICEWVPNATDLTGCEKTLNTNHDFPLLQSAQQIALLVMMTGSAPTAKMDTT